MTTRIHFSCAELSRSIPYLLLLALTLPSCKKDDDAPSSSGGGTPPLQIFGVPIPGIFTWPDGGDDIGYLQGDDLCCSPIFRGSAVNTVSMSDLAAQDNCRIELIGKDLDNGPVVYGVHRPGTSQWWVPIDQSGDLRLEQDELGITSMPNFGGNWCWIRHSQGSIDGNPVYAMESYTNPGMYWSLNFPLSCGNCIKLTSHSDPSFAQGFIFR